MAQPDNVSLPNTTTVKQVRKPVTVRATKIDDVPVVAADFFKVLVDPQTGNATLVFYRRRPVAERSEEENGGMIINTLDEEAFLEVKVPLRPAFTTAVWMSLLNEEMKKNQNQLPNRATFTFGPAGVA